jgi:hypothetical protein
MTVSSNIIQRKISLEHERKKDGLNRRLSLRPTAGDLKMRNILRGKFWLMIDEQTVGEDGGSQEDSSSEKSEEEAPETFEARQVALKSCLKRRPTRAMLTENNILKGKFT